MSGGRAFLVTFTTLVVAGLALGLALSLADEQPRRVQAVAKPGQVATAQTAAGRSWVSHPWHRELELTAGGDGDALAKPVEVAVDGAGDLYVLDAVARRVLRFTPAGELRHTYGNGGRPEDGLLAQPTSLAVDAAGDLWIADPGNSTLLRFAPDGSVRRALHVAQQPMRVQPLPEGRALVMLARPQRAVLAVLDADGALATELDGLLAGGPDALALDGSLASSGAGPVYAGVHVGWLAGFSPAGRRRWLVETLDPVPLPEIEVEGSRRRVVSRRAATFGLAAHGDRVYALTRDRAGRSVVDVYAAADGGYRSSFVPPADAEGLFVTDDRLYLAGTRAVGAWTWGGGPLAPDDDDDDGR